MFTTKKHLLLFLIFGSALLSACSTPTITSNNLHKMGRQMDVRYYPVKGLKGANHTYPEAFTNTGVRKAWPALGGDQGGKVLAKTTTKCEKDCVDIDTVNYIMSEPPCIWPKKDYYAVVGVCWNATNRGLYYTNKTVHNIPHYGIVEFYFGTYGLDNGSSCFSDKCKKGRNLYSWTKCRKSVENNYPWRASVASLQESPNPRIELYNRYFGATQDVSLMSLSEKDKFFQYLQSLVSLHANQTLGVTESDNKLISIKEVHKNWFDKISRIEIINNDHEQYLDDLNRAFNGELDDFRKILTDDEFEKFFNATKKQSFDIRNFSR